MIRTERSGLVYYQFAALAAEPGLRHGFFTRLGGVSRSPYASLNVGGSVGDDAEAVAENRRRLYAALELDEARVATPFQVHSTRIVRVGAAEGGRVIDETDGLLTDEPGMALFLRFADCAPIVLYDRRRRAVGLIHAGWRGALAGIAALAVQAMRAEFGSAPGDLWAGIGPCIGACCYEVGAELGEQFIRRFGPQVVSRHAMGTVHLDLTQANVLALKEAGVHRAVSADLCTSCHCDEFFSHRREHGRTGRFAAIVALT